MMRVHPTLVLALVVVPGCYSPNAIPNETSSQPSSSDSSGSDTNVDESSSTSGPSGASDTSRGDESTTDAPRHGICGDGVVDADEECDDGSLNGPGAFCHADCRLNVCGDGDKSPNEVCDDGADNKLEIGACAPDCSKLINSKRISVSISSLQDNSLLANGDLMPDPISKLDALCAQSEKALFVFGDSRRAATVPLVPDPMNWVLAPYTAYLTSSDQLVWITDSVPLLGVREGVATPLQNSIQSPGPGTDGVQVITGAREDWTTANETTCQNWSSAEANNFVSIGDPLSLVNYLRGAATRSCAQWGVDYNNRFTVYCVEQ